MPSEAASRDDEPNASEDQLCGRLVVGRTERRPKLYIIIRLAMFSSVAVIEWHAQHRTIRERQRRRRRPTKNFDIGTRS